MSKQQESFYVTICGKSVSVYAYNNSKSNTSTINNSRNYNSSNENEYKLKRSLRRRKTMIVKFIGSVKNEPNLFISVIFPNDYNRDYLKRKYCLKRLKQEITRKYDNSWLLCKLEYSECAGIHAHLLSYMPNCDCENDDDIKTVNIKLGKIWGRIVDSHDKNLVDVRKYNKHTTYLTGKKKTKMDLECIKIAGNDYTVSIIGRKNIEFKDTTKLEVTKLELYIFKIAYTKYLIKNNHDTENVIRQFLKESFHVTAFDQGVVEELFMISKRKAALYANKKDFDSRKSYLNWLLKEHIINMEKHNYYYEKYYRE